MLAELRDGNSDIQHEFVETAQQLREVLSNTFQLIIANSLAEHPALIADITALLLENNLDIPLLAYSAASEHEHIVNVMHDGAQDFISANNPQRILPAVQRELHNAGLRSVQREQIVIDYLLQEIDGLILQEWDVDRLLARLCQRVIDLFDFTLVWIGIKKPDGVVEMAAAAGATEYLEQIEVRWDDSPQGNGTTGRAIKTGQHVALSVRDPEFAPWREVAERFGMQSILALPMKAHGDTIGALMLYCSRREAFDQAVIMRFSAFANRVAVVLKVAQEQQQLRMFSAAMNTAANAMFISAPDGEIIWFNDALNAYSGYARDELLNRNPRLFDSGEHDKAFWRDMWQTITQGKSWRNDVVNRRKDGSLFNVVLNVTPMYDSNGGQAHYLAVLQDVTEKKELEREIEYMAYHDVLTDLPNRVLFQDRMQQAITQSKRDKGKFALLFIDLDGFKHINDTHGHAAGDRLLQMAAERLRGCVREGDTVSRLSGDEFTVLLLDVTTREGLQRVTDMFLEKIGEPYDLGGFSENITASIGVSLYPEHATGAEKLMSYADQAMYLAKQSGKNNCQLY
ncbi:MAG: diguanylate cyclase, partial [Gallionella sp.]